MSYDLSMCDGKTIATIETMFPGDDPVDTQTLRIVFTDGHQLVLQTKTVGDSEDDPPAPAGFLIACTIAPVYRPDAMGYAIARAVQ